MMKLYVTIIFFGILGGPALAFKPPSRQLHTVYTGTMTSSLQASKVSNFADDSILRARHVLKMSTGAEIPAENVAVAVAPSPAPSGASKLKIGGLFGLWYALNIGYNIYNKKVLNLAPELTWWAAWFQMAMGLLLVLPAWGSGLRKPPKVNKSDVKTLMPVALLHSLVHIGGVVSMGAGAVSFAHIVKASEPAVSAGLSALFLKQFLPLPVYLTLLPVMGGVALASLGELSFSWKAFNYAMLSNVASASRGIVGKKTMGAGVGENMTPSNLYGVLTALATILLLPVALILEGKALFPALKALSAAGQGRTFALQTLAAGLFYYLYNEVAFLCLDNVAPVTHALGNTIKRVVIILTSVLVFGTKLTSTGILGSSMAISGVLLYSLAKQKFSK
jgi:solute carrier family 35 protein E1